MASATAERSLNLLAAIERTVSVMSGVAEQLAANSAVVEALTERIRAIPKALKLLDPGNLLAARFDLVQEAAQMLARKYEARRLSALDDPALREDDGVADCYAEAIEQLERMFEAYEDLKVAIAEHDADASPVSRSFDNVDDLIAALRS